MFNILLQIFNVVCVNIEFFKIRKIVHKIIERNLQIEQEIANAYYNQSKDETKNSDHKENNLEINGFQKEDTIVIVCGNNQDINNYILNTETNLVQNNKNDSNINNSKENNNNEERENKLIIINRETNLKAESTKNIPNMKDIKKENVNIYKYGNISSKILKEVNTNKLNSKNVKINKNNKNKEDEKEKELKGLQHKDHILKINQKIKPSLKFTKTTIEEDSVRKMTADTSSVDENERSKSKKDSKVNDK